MRHHQLSRCTVLGLALAALAAPIATAAAQAPVNPDAAAAQRSVDLRSPDARDAAAAATRAASAGAAGTSRPVDLRSPDARDAAAGRTSVGAAAVTSPSLPSIHSSNDRFDWGDAGIGAALLLGALVLAGAGTLLVLRHRTNAPPRRDVASAG